MDVNNPLKMVLIGIDPYPYFLTKTAFEGDIPSFCLLQFFLQLGATETQMQLDPFVVVFGQFLLESCCGSSGDGGHGMGVGIWAILGTSTSNIEVLHLTNLLAKHLS